MNTTLVLDFTLFSLLVAVLSIVMTAPLFGALMSWSGHSWLVQEKGQGLHPDAGEGEGEGEEQERPREGEGDGDVAREAGRGFCGEDSYAGGAKISTEPLLMKCAVDNMDA